MTLSSFYNRARWRRLGRFVATVLLAFLPMTGWAQHSDTSSQRSSTDSTCVDARPTRSTAPFRITTGADPLVAVRGLHVRVGAANARDARTCYTVSGIELGWIGAAQRIRGLSVGLGNVADVVTGVEVNLASTGTIRHGVFLTGVFGADTRAVGVSAALFKNRLYRGYGLFGGLWNDGNMITGGMVGAINGANRMHGLQTGLLNSARHMRGLQIGLYNRAESLRGVQIGLLNVSASQSGSVRRMTFINVGT